MTLKNVERVTFSLPKTIIVKLEMKIPKSKRSKFIADLIGKKLEEEFEEAFIMVDGEWQEIFDVIPDTKSDSNYSMEDKYETLDEVHEFWDGFRKKYKSKTDKSSLELIREDRASH